MILDSNVHGANIGPTWVMSAPVGPHAGPVNLAIRDIQQFDIEGLIPCKILQIY